MEEATITNPYASFREAKEKLDAVLSGSAAIDLDKARERVKRRDEIANKYKAKIAEADRKIVSHQEFVAEMDRLRKNIDSNRQRWAEEALTLFEKACIANVRIELHPDGYSIIDGDDSGSKREGLYTSPEKHCRYTVDATCDSKMLEDLVKLCGTVTPYWRYVLDSNKSFWDKARENKGIAINQAMTAEDYMTELRKDADRLRSDKEHIAEEFRMKIDPYTDVDSELEKCERNMAKDNTIKAEAERTMRQAIDAMVERDPIGAGFLTTSGGSGVYDAAWLSLVKRAAEKRQSMPVLPLTPWSDDGPGENYDWAEEMKVGGNNIIIQSHHSTTPEQRRAMLDNVVATLLLAFPIRRVHLTVIEHDQVSTFITNMPKNICEVYNCADSENMRRIINTLNERNRNERNSRIPPCAPRELVILSGYDPDDRHFEDFLEATRNTVKEGAAAGIYFIVLLSEKISEYIKDDECTIDYIDAFERYNGLSVEAEEDAANWHPDVEEWDDGLMPDTGLLEREAVMTDEDGREHSCSLGELILSHITKEAQTIPNKVYEPIASGELYESSPISDLADQRRDQHTIVVPFADSDDGMEMNLKFDTQDHLFTFILGRSGMGKSFMLHTLLTNMMLRYDPSVLEVILMDFKPGGVEMNYYKDVPHVSKLLVNGADKQVAGEILRSIEKDITRRGEMMQASGTQNLESYNAYARSHGLPLMKHVVLLVDECQDLFKLESEGHGKSIVVEIARKGRSFGIHMVFATQTLMGTEIANDALEQFTDFLFMGCRDSDVEKCGIRDRNVQNAVGGLRKGEVFYCRRDSEPIHGYVYNYSGNKGEYREKTAENLRSSRFTHPEEAQFYFNANQEYSIGADTLAEIDRAQGGRSSSPVAALGRNLSVKGETLMAKFLRDGACQSNLLITGINNRLQAERVLWNSVLSLYYSNRRAGRKAQYKILDTFPSDIDEEARADADIRDSLVDTLGELPGVEMVKDRQRINMIERVATTVHSRMALADSNPEALDDLDTIYLVMPNQHMYFRNIKGMTKGLPGLDGAIAATPSAGVNIAATQFEMPAPAPAPRVMMDELGFEVVMTREQLLAQKEEEERRKAPKPQVDEFGFEMPAAKPQVDELGFEIPATGGSDNPFDQPNPFAQKSSGPAFAKIETGDDYMARTSPVHSEPVFSASTMSSFDPSRPRRLEEEMVYILQNGPSVKVHVIIQVTDPSAIVDGSISRKDLANYFNDIVSLRMVQSSILPDQIAREAETLSSNVKSLRAAYYSSGTGSLLTFVPFTLPANVRETFRF